MNDPNFKRIAVIATIIVLAILSFLIIKPIFTPIILGLCLSYIFFPIHKALSKRIKSETFSAIIIIILILVIVIMPLILLLHSIGRELFAVYNTIREADLYPIITKLFPSLVENKQLAAEISTAIGNFKLQLSSLMLQFFEVTITKLPQIVFGAIILLFTFFFGLKEGNNFKEYFSILFPFAEEYEERFYKQFGKVTSAVLYGQFMVGVFQGIIAAIGYYLLGIPNALLVSILTLFVGILPFIGPWLVWIPMDILLFVSGETERGIALAIYGLFVINWVETILGPRIVSSRIKINPAIVLIGIVGGVYAFGIIGLLLGPLVLSYLILLVEIYKNKKKESIIFKKEEEKIP